MASLLAETRWTNRQFASAVNRVGAEAGLRLNYDDSAICHWLTGTLPRARVRPVICEALARRLQRPVTLAGAGLGAAQADDQPPDIVTGLMELGSADMDPSRREVLGSLGLYSAALAIPGWADVQGRFTLLRTNPRVRIGHAEVGHWAQIGYRIVRRVNVQIRHDPPQARDESVRSPAERANRGFGRV